MKKFLAILLAFAMVFAFAACGTKKNQGKEKNDDTTIFTIKFAGGHTEDNPITRCWTECFIPYVEEASKGRVKVEYFANSQLGNETDMLDQVVMGDAQMMYCSETISSIDPAITMMSLPFLFSDEAMLDKVFDGEIGNTIGNEYNDNGLTYLGWLENGFRVITNSKRAINTPEDVKGLKIRVLQSDIPIAMFTALGANVVPMAFTELYSALSNGTVDGQENAYATIATNSIQDVQKYFANTNHQMGVFIIVANQDWFKSLPEDIQGIIVEGCKRASTYERAAFREASSGYRQQMLDAGMKETNPDTAAFQTVCSGVYDDFYSKYPAYKPIVEKIIELGK